MDPQLENRFVYEEGLNSGNNGRLGTSGEDISMRLSQRQRSHSSTVYHCRWGACPDNQAAGAWLINQRVRYFLLAVVLFHWRLNCWRKMI